MTVDLIFKSKATLIFFACAVVAFVGLYVGYEYEFKNQPWNLPHTFETYMPEGEYELVQNITAAGAETVNMGHLQQHANGKKILFSVRNVDGNGAQITYAVNDNGYFLFKQYIELGFSLDRWGHAGNKLFISGTKFNFSLLGFSLMGLVWLMLALWNLFFVLKLLGTILLMIFFWGATRIANLSSPFNRAV